MFHKDTSFIITVQLTLIGIVLVAGLYLLWKAAARIEEKVDLLLMDKQTQCLFPKEEDTHISQDLTAQMNQDEFMKNVFSESLTDNQTNNGGFVFFSSNTYDNEESESQVKDVMIEEVSVKESVTNDYSKSKLRQMNLEKLKELCLSKNLSTEGTKNQLIESLLAN
jgi:hypothetical protein